MKKYLCIGFLMGAILSTSLHANVKIFLGKLTYKDSREQWVQLVLYESLRLSLVGKQVLKKYSATVVMYFGNELTPEYLHVNYSRVYFNPKKNEYLMVPDVDDTVLSRKPTLRLYENKAGILEGDFFGFRDGKMGTLKLQDSKNFEFKSIDNSKIVPAIGGRYDAYCSSTEKSLHLKSLVIFPTRIAVPQGIVSEALQANLNYVGATYCDSTYLRDVNCLNLSSGIYDFGNQKLHLFVNNNYIFECEVKKGSLYCSCERFKDCSFTKNYENFFQSIDLSNLFSHTRNLSRSRSLGKCEDWEGEFFGKLTHKLDSREQAVKMHFSAFDLADDEGISRCILRGGASLYFGSKPKDSESIQYTFHEVDYDTTANELLLPSLPNEDLVMQPILKEKDRIQGYWFSRNFGLVGEFDVYRKEKKALKNAVPGLAGKYDWAGQKGWELELFTTQSGSYPESYNPFAGVHLSGHIFHDGKLGGTHFPIRDSIFFSSYDFYINELFLMTSGNFFEGRVYEEMIKLKAFSKNHMGSMSSKFYRRTFKKQ